MEGPTTIRVSTDPGEALFAELRTALARGKNGGMVAFHEPYHLYLIDSQADTYLSLMQEPVYSCSFHAAIRRLIATHRRRLLEGLGSRFEIVDLGPGYPDKTFPLLQQAVNQGGCCRYVPVDISPKFLRIAAEACARFGFPACPRRCLFEDLASTLDRRGPECSRLFILGVTFMNYSPEEAVNLLAGMLRGRDAAVIATELLGARALDEVLTPYRTGKARAFNLMPLQLCGLDGSAMRYFVRFREGRIEMGFQTEAGVRVRDLEVPAGTGIITSVSYRYPPSQLLSLLKRAFPKVDWFQDAGGTSAIARISLNG
jgi:uncharacterized SAM-dependent methyltransferase